MGEKLGGGRNQGVGWFQSSDDSFAFLKNKKLIFKMLYQLKSSPLFPFEKNSSPPLSMVLTSQPGAYPINFDPPSIEGVINYVTIMIMNGELPFQRTGTQETEL